MEFGERVFLSRLVFYGVSEKITSGFFFRFPPTSPPRPHLGIPVSAASWIMRKLAGIVTLLAQVAKRQNCENMSFTGIFPAENRHPTVGPEGQRLMSAFWFGGMEVWNGLSQRCNEGFTLAQTKY